MELLTPEILQPLGVSAVLAVFLWLAWKRLESKDQRIREITDNLEKRYEENTKMTERVNNTLAKNNEITEKVLMRFDDAMRNSSNRNN